MEEQENYLQKATFKEIIIRGTKKVLTELTSVKFLAMCGIFALMAYNKIGDVAGIVGILAILGIRDLPESIIQKINGGSNKPPEDISKQ